MKSCSWTATIVIGLLVGAILTRFAYSWKWWVACIILNFAGQRIWAMIGSPPKL